jgi:hypothetical protein
MASKALLIGINKTLEFPPLMGAINDVRLMYKILKEVYGFTEFKVLDDQVATRRNIMKGFKWAFTNVSPNDRIFIFYSGHGTQIPTTLDTACFETDGFDECLVPYDMDWDDPLRDDDIGRFLATVTPQATIIFQMDCCFSGTLLKNPLPPKVINKYIPPPLHIELANSDVNLDDELNTDTSKMARGKMMRAPFIVDSGTQGNAILISGCTDKQTSADAYINGRYHGALTFYVAQTLKENNWKISYRRLIEVVNEKLAKEDYDQQPQLEAREELMDKNFLE